MVLDAELPDFEDSEYIPTLPPGMEEDEARVPLMTQMVEEGFEGEL
jgi:hypothetical protein